MNEKTKDKKCDLNDFRKWLEDFQVYSGKGCIEILDGRMKDDNKDGQMCIKIYTETNSYNILAICKPENNRSYLGCGASSRKPRAGEKWFRGNDLPDGKLTYQTWYKILIGIISYEMVKIHKIKIPKEDVETQEEDIVK